jgi:hypothetical protein
MTELQAKAFKIGLLWIACSHQIFPNYKHDKGYPKRGDPRNSNLFRQCFRLVRESQGLIADEEYTLYVKAQLQMLKHIQIGDVCPLISPNCLAGDKAWIRWKIWKRKYAQQMKAKTVEEVTDITLDEIKRELKQTKTYLRGKFGGEPKEESIRMACLDLARWIALDKVSPFYVIMSPWVKKYCQVSKDLSLYEPFVTDEALAHFKELFAYEFLNTA